MERLIQDLTTAVRAWRSTVKLASLVVVTLSIAIGVTVPTFAVLYAVRYKPLPYPEPDRLVTVWVSQRREMNEWGLFPRTATDLADGSGIFAAIAWTVESHPQVVGRTAPEELRGAAVSAAFFDVFQIRPQYGRTFVSGDDDIGAAGVAVLGHSVWRRLFGGDPSVIGRTIRLDDEAVTVIGVMPASFRYPQDAEIWRPRAVPADEMRQSGPGPYEVVARLRADIRQETAVERANIVIGRLPISPPVTGPLRVSLVPLNDVETVQFQQPLVILCGAVALVLIIACANTGSLLAARSLDRRQEFAVRASLGAGPGRLVRQVIAEILLLTGFASVGGLILASWILNFFIVLGGSRVPRLGEATLDGRLLLFGIGVSW